MSGTLADLMRRSGPSAGQNSMKGLVQFIADLRNARARDLEEKRINKELANIRQKFKEGNLSGYHRKKYVCKLLYIYILGWNVDFGHLEAVNLISATKYSEKQIGYLAVTLFLHEQHELLHLVVNSIRKDLTGHNELFNCLALHAIANVGSREMAEALSADVHMLLISPTSKAFVKKKAALTLLRLYRRYPAIIQEEWAERMIALMDDPDLGVRLSVTSLVMTLAQDRQEEYKNSYIKAAQGLKRVACDMDIPDDYFYYKVPCPWLQVKLLRLMQYYPPSEDTYVRDLIRQSIEQILHEALIAPKNVQQNNAQNAILFEAINLVIHLDSEVELMMQISQKLGKFITSRETNVRYLGLEAMTHFTARAETLDPIKEHQSVILGSLQDRDISVRRKGLDLLYSMCDQTNAQTIVQELLRYLARADFAIREELVLKIAILTEKYATDVEWYVNISLRLIAMAGDHVSEEVWQRIIMIVTNNESLQVYAATTILEYIKADQCHETLVKLGAYILGEFGHLIAETKGCSPIEQFVALQMKLTSCSVSTRAMLLSCFIKYVNLFPEIKNHLVQILRLYTHTMDPELQQRACEYLMLATLPSDDLLRTLCDEMPPFPERASALLSRLHSKVAVPGDKRTWIVGGKEANSNAQEAVIAQKTGLPGANGGLGDLNGSNGSNGHGLAGLDMASQNGSETGAPVNVPSRLSPGWEKGYNLMLFADEGILYEDGQLQVGIRSEYRGPVGAVILYYTNKTGADITSFTTTINNPSGTEKLSINLRNIPDTTIGHEVQVQQTIMFEARTLFSEPPTIRISYLAGSLQAINLKLPITAHKYMEGAQLTGEDFFKRWKQIGGAPREAQSVFGVKDKNRIIDASYTRRVTERFKWGILQGVDPNAKNIVGASVMHTTQGGKYGCLLRLEPNYDNQMYRITIRATDEGLPAVLMKLMEDKFSMGKVSKD